MNKKPIVILKDLPPGDPERSMGKYGKLDRIFNIDRKTFYNLNEGLEKTIIFFNGSS